MSPVLFLAIIFAASYSQAPLYYSNQNQYFLHGLAQSGTGFLSDDWLAGTADPTPLFSALVAWTARNFQPWVFYLYHAILMAVYATAMMNLFATLHGRAEHREVPDSTGTIRHLTVLGSPISRALAFAFALVLVHSSAARWCSYRLCNFDYLWFFQAGLAGQYLLGPMFQPSVFGVFLVLAVSFFVRGRFISSALCVAAAGIMHNTYLLTGAMLTCGFIAALCQERRYRLALIVGSLTLVLVLPFAYHSWHTFAPSSPEQFAAAQKILIDFRIPHHTRPDHWLDTISYLQIGWMVLGVVLVWRTRLGIVLGVSLFLATLLSVLQIATGNPMLALLFPWRMSAVLVPIATTIVLARLVGRQGRAVGVSPPCGTSTTPDATHGGLTTTARPPLPLYLVSIIGMGILAAAGIGISFGRVAFQEGDEEVELMEFVQQHKRKGDVYFLPVKLPDSASKPGNANNNFAHLSVRKRDLIPLDMQRFRLYTGAPIYIDFKSIPYKDLDVIEWRDRIRVVESVYEAINAGRLSKALGTLREKKVTHLVWPTDPEGKKLSDPGLRFLHRDEHYEVYRLE